MLQEAKAFLKEIGVDKVLMTTNPKTLPLKSDQT